MFTRYVYSIVLLHAMSGTNRKLPVVSLVWYDVEGFLGYCTVLQVP